MVRIGRNPCLASAYLPLPVKASSNGGMSGTGKSGGVSGIGKRGGENVEGTFALNGQNGVPVRGATGDAGG
ncbi:hypothetical protein [Pectobacterium versatile]|uniref:hypothetical protein n=1 Tax=Pectobacterium versatile TaxID=2488639 RepID=UPI001CCCC65F|nr:hypothetical protein [Pectobacterium versatile]